MHHLAFLGHNFGCKKIINFHSVQFLIMSNILCFHMPDDGPAEDGPEKKLNLLKQK